MTDEILRVAGQSLRGVAQLHAQRRGAVAQLAPSARLMSQWVGVYLVHAQGLLSASMRAADIAGPRLLGDERAANVHVVTGLGGSGMTVSPALGEENVARWFA